MSQSRLATDVETRDANASDEPPTLAVDRHGFELPPLVVPKQGDQVGRYVVEGTIGEGGMGVVVRARDPKLDRVVALKLLRAKGGLERSEGPTRLLREAQALAKLSHPNIIDVFDVGTIDGQVFIAMEYVPGQTLGAWQNSAARTLDEILDAYIAAGRGLAAAHAAGLVHRDFKPHNVLRGEDGRVRVVDFGLAAPTGRKSGVSVTNADASQDAFDIRVTATGLVMGTPAYMAPECHRGEPVDARSDQFSYCVALFEALYGRRPFRGPSPRQLQRQVEGGQIEFPAEADVPGGVRSVVVRGLSRDPGDRWPSIDALIDALRPPRSKAWGWGLALLTAVGVGGLIIASDDRPDVCEQAATRVQAAFSKDRRAAISTAFSASGVSYADETLERVSPRLDAYVTELAAARRSACEANRAKQAEDTDLASVCYERRLADLESLVAVLAEADATGVRNAVKAVANLAPVSRCEREASSDLAPPPAIAEAVEAARAKLGKAKAMRTVGKLADARALVDEALAQAEALDYEPLLAESLLRRAYLEEEAGDYPEAAASLEKATHAGQASGHDEVVAEATTQLVYIVGNQLHRHEEAGEWERHAVAAIERQGGAPDRDLNLLSSRGNLASARGRPDQAKTLFSRALEIADAQGHAMAPVLRNNLGMALHELGDNEGALQMLHETLEQRIEVLGANHPEVGGTHGNLGVLYQTLGKLDEAALHTQKGLDIIASALGKEHPNYARLLTNLANTEYLRGDFDASARLHEEALELFRISMGPRSVQEGKALSNLGVVAHRRGRPAEALELYRRALAVWEERLGPDHPELSSAVSNIALLDADAERYDEAIAGFTRALKLQESIGPDNPALASALVGRGNARVASEDVEGGIEDLRRAIELRDGADEDPRKVGEAQFGLGRALWKAGKHAEARAAVERAKASVEAGPDDSTNLHADIETWLAEHPTSP